MGANVMILFVLLLMALGYIVYLRVQLYINSRIVKAFQSAAVVIPPAAKPKDNGVSLGLVVFGLFILMAAMGNLMN